MQLLVNLDPVLTPEQTKETVIALLDKGLEITTIIWLLRLVVGDFADGDISELQKVDGVTGVTTDAEMEEQVAATLADIKASGASVDPAFERARASLEALFDDIDGVEVGRAIMMDGKGKPFIPVYVPSEGHLQALPPYHGGVRIVGRVDGERTATAAE